MRIIRVQIFVLAIAAILLAGLGTAVGYWILPRDGAAPTMPVAQAESTVRKPLYYQDPDGKPVYAATPKKTADGRPFKAVYATPIEQANASPPKRTGQILYYRNPMGLPDVSRVPKEDSMGMDYVPVREGEEEPGTVEVSPERLQMLGVTTAQVALRPTLENTVHATGIVEADESKLAAVTTKFDGVVEKLFVATTGADVRAGEPLARVWIQTPDTMMQIGPDLITRQIDYVVALQDKDPVAIAQTARVLKEYGMPDSALAEIRRTGRATRSITIAAPRSGVVIEKPAVEGMHFNTGDPLFKIADLSDVWVSADVAEQDLGAIRAGETVHVAFVAFPGRSFEGRVDFIYPMLTANTRTGHIRIVLSNPDGLFRESMYATVAIDTPVAAQGEVLVVPDSAIIDSGAHQVVLVEKGPGRFEPRAVHLGARANGTAQVLGGVKAGERIVTSANFLIDAESNLRAALLTFAMGEKTAQADEKK